MRFPPRGNRSLDAMLAPEQEAALFTTMMALPLKGDTVNVLMLHGRLRGTLVRGVVRTIGATDDGRYMVIFLDDASAISTLTLVFVSKKVEHDGGLRTAMADLQDEVNAELRALHPERANVRGLLWGWALIVTREEIAAAAMETIARDN